MKLKAHRFIRYSDIKNLVKASSGGGGDTPIIDPTKPDITLPGTLNTDGSIQLTLGTISNGVLQF